MTSVSAEDKLLQVDATIGALHLVVDSDGSPENYSSVVERLKALVSDESALRALTDETTQEIRRLLMIRLPESACGQEDVIEPIRANLWSVMLLGLRPEDLNRRVVYLFRPQDERWGIAQLCHTCVGHPPVIAVVL